MSAISLLHIGIAYALLSVACLLFLICLCVAASRADDELDHARREQERRQDSTNFPLAPDPKKSRIEHRGGWWGR